MTNKLGRRSIEKRARLTIHLSNVDYMEERVVKAISIEATTLVKAKRPVNTLSFPDLTLNEAKDMLAKVYNDLSGDATISKSSWGPESLAKTVHNLKTNKKIKHGL